MEFLLEENLHVLEEDEILETAVENSFLQKDALEDCWTVEPVLEVEVAGCEDEVVLETEDEEILKITEAVLKKSREGKELIFFELYVDEGRISHYLAKNYPEVVVSTFSLPEWDFSKAEVRKQFLSLVKLVKPHFIWMAPPWTKWSPMQQLNMVQMWQKIKILEARKIEERSHLSLAKDVYYKCSKEDIGFGFEHPYHAASWKTDSMESMTGYLEAVCDRCRTGLKYYENGVCLDLVKKPTRVKTTSSYVADALDLRCNCPSGIHVHMEGKTKSLHAMQNYEPEFIRRASVAIHQEMEAVWKLREIFNIFVIEEMMEED